VASQGVEIVFLGSGDGRLELLAPTRDDSPLAKFLAKRGPGMHHLCYRVDDIAAELARYREMGAELIDEVPRPGGAGHLVAFVHPRSTGGVLVELLQHV
jgi:methylmalonyl-CoA epimerase